MSSRKSLYSSAIACAACITVFALASVSAQDSEEPATGLIFADEAAYRSVPLATSPLRGDLPTEVDYSSLFPEPGNQGAQSSCVAWAVAYALKGYQEKQERKWDLAKIAHQFSPAFIYNQICRDCDSGSSFVDALDLLSRQGVATWDKFPYNAAECSRKPTEAVKQSAGEFRIASWRRVNVQDTTEVRSHLAAGFPVLIGMVVDTNFKNLGRGDTYSTPGGRSLGGHAMVLTGYEDSREAFRVLNSWGTNWGEEGFGWITYAAFRQKVREAYVAQDIVVSSPPGPQRTPRPSPTPRPVDPDADSEDEEVSPTPSPTPRPRRALIPRVDLNDATVTHNIVSNGTPGMSIKLPGRLLNSTGKTAQLMVRFSQPNGQPLLANPREPRLRDSQGLVATGTDVFAVTSADADLSVYQMFIPYYALNLNPTNYQFVYQVSLTVTVYVDNFQIGQSAPTAFTVRW